MASESDLIADSINKPLMGVAAAMVAFGFLLCLTFALLPVGLILMAAGVVWAFGLYAIAVFRAKVDRVDHFESVRQHP